MTPDDPNQPNGLRFRLSAGTDQPDALPAGNVAPATPLGEGDTANLLKRLPPGKTDPNDKQDFALRDKSLPPPRTGQTVQKPFPALEPPKARPPDTGDSGPLEVVRFSPQGEVPAAPQLQITFSQPMIPITSQDEAASIVPVRIVPQAPGKWRWLGTRTLMFAPDGRFPMATVYKVSIPAGTKSVNGGALAKEFSFTFSTPPPAVIQKYPEGQTGLARDTMIYLAFDQRIDPAKALAVTRVTGNSKPLLTRLATEQESAGWKNSAEPGRWLAVRVIDNEGQTANALPGDANIIVTVGPNIPSAEGPRTNPKTVSFNFRTYGALKMVNFQCGYNNKCSPFDTWQINFSNPLDTANFKREMLKIEPEAAGVKAAVYGNTIQLSGVKKGRTKYTVTIDQNLKDVYGQTLGRPEQAVFNVGSADQTLFAPGGDMVILDPTGPARFTVYTTNHNTLNVKLYAVTPQDWPAWAAYRRYREGYDDDEAKKQTTPPGRFVFSKAVTVNNKPDELTETGIDLTPALKGDFGQVIAIIEQPGLTQRLRRRYERNNVEAWIQRTQIGLDAFVDHQQLVGWATSLKDGKPIAGAELSIVPGNAEVIGQNAKPEQSWGEWLMSFVGGEPAADSGQPAVAGEEVSEAHAAPKGEMTGADGVLRFALPSESSRARLLVARKGNDVAILPEYDYYYQSGSNWYQHGLGESLRWFTFDDRKLYRPGEEVKIKGWLRRVTNGPTGDVEAFNNSFKSFNYTLRDAQGNELSKGTANINALGGFDLSLKLPPTMNLGDAYVQFLDAGGNNLYQHQFSVQEFRRPEFEVSAQTSEGPHYVGGAANVTVSASYFAGGGLANAAVNWRVTARPTTYTPPGWDEWTFGTWVPWWYNYGENYAGQSTQAFQGKTDAAGKHRLKVDFDGVKPPRAYAIEAEASVQDVNRQTFAARSSFIVHPARVYVGLKAERAFVEQGTPLNMQAAVVDVDGKPIVNRDAAIKAVRLDWEFENGSWQQKELNTQEFNVKTDAQGRIAYRVETKGGGGRYRVTARVMDDNERPNESEMTLWVSGGKVVPSREVTQEKVELIPSKKDFQPGDTAEILVQAPFAPAEGILTLRREGLVTTQRFRVENSTYTLKIPIVESYLPNITAQVDLVGAAARTDDKGQVDAKLPKRPAFASGSLNLSIPPLKRKLSVAATPRDKAVTPGGETVVNVEVKTANGEPVRDSEIAVIVVDESVLALTGYKITDPLYTFYTQRGDGVSDFHSRSKVLLGNPDDVAKEAQRQNQISADSFGGRAVGIMAESTMAAPGAPPPPPAKPQAARKAVARDGLAKDADDKPDEPNQPEIRLRENFNALAVFAPAVPTDANGRATVNVKLPDNLTRYRVTVVAVSGGKLFGIGESAITARQPLMVRPSAPRFLNFGDQFELPVVVQNQTDDPMTVDVGVRATNLTLTAGAGRRVVVPANDRVEVRFPAAAEMAGTARLQIGVSSGKWADAAEISLPVWTPATTEAFATYGTIDANGAMAQPVQLPGGVVKQFGGLEITTSSTQLQELTDAVIYLQNYPYGCSEQISSRVLGIAALRDVLTAFKSKDLPSPDELKKGVEAGIKQLEGRQNPDGSFGLWKRNDYGNDWPFLTLHVTHALVRAKAKGFNVPDEMLKKALGYVKNIESHIPKYYSKESRWAISAYALNIRVLGGDRDTAKARKLITEAGLEKLSLESIGWLLTVLSPGYDPAKPGTPVAPDPQVVAIRRLLNNRVTETAGAANFVDSYTDGAQFLLHSNRRTDGIILEALIGDQPDNDLIPKIVRGLLANKTRGHWLNTQENVFILLALDKYFNTYEKVEPNFVARVWLGQAYAGEQAYKGRSTDRNNINVPMSYLFDHPGPQNLILDKQGAGRLYYRIGLNYAPSDLMLKAADYGFKVERIYEAVDKPEDVKRDADGTWRVKAGTRVRVRLKMTVPSRRYHVALVDPLPAGLEILNPELATTERLPEDTGQTGVAEYGSRSYGYGSYWYRAIWFDHQNFRDERAEAFTSLLWEGVWNYSYVARATTPGRFVVPPTKAEEMYMPETFGRSATDKVVVE